MPPAFCLRNERQRIRVMMNQHNNRLDKARKLPGLLRDFADRCKRWNSLRSADEQDEAAECLLDDLRAGDPDAWLNSFKDTTSDQYCAIRPRLLCHSGDAAREFEKLYGEVKEYLARWYLMSHDPRVNRILSDVLAITHLVSFCEHVADEIEAQQAVPDEPSATEEDSDDEPPGKPQAKSDTLSWKPPAGYLNAKEIKDKYGVPRSTLQAWQQQDDVPKGPLDKKLKKAPGRAHTLYYPEKWVIKRHKTWAGNHRKR